MGSVVGSSLGQGAHCWPGSRRTLEGSLAVFLSSLSVLVAIHTFVVCGDCLRGHRNSGAWAEAAAHLAWPVGLASLMEAFTSQVDNLVLPCLLFSALVVTAQSTSVA
ncbi:unnamed protein product [Discosporangium mesarthrocarpum]